MREVPILGERPDEIWHYTCGHGRQAIGGAGKAMPLRYLMVTNELDHQDEATKRIAGLVWFTSVSTISTRESARSIGLDRTEVLKCERWTHRYRVGKRFIKDLVPWRMERIAWPDHIRNALEHASPGIEPMLWWVSSKPVPVFYDPVPEPVKKSRIIVAR